MLSLIERILSRLRGETLKLFFLAGGLLLIWGTVAPIGTLVWWLNQGVEGLGLRRETKKLPATVARATQKIVNCYIVYLPGVGDSSANELSAGEEYFLDRLQKAHPNCVTVRDVFPYSAANQDLAGQRFLAPFWQAAQKGEGWFKNADVLIKIRNLWRFAISADDRYAPVYNQGIAAAIVDRMNAVHPISQSGQPIRVVLIGTSGGVQVALGAVPYLNEWIKPELAVVSAGGAFDGEAGFESAQRVYHLQGDRDWVDDIPRVVFASRWPWAIQSPFNQARQQGRFTSLDSGNHTHDGAQGYFGQAMAHDRTTYVDLTLQKVNQLPIWSNNK
ncbi:hypothetical protein ACKFKF_17010 [Phormidesmis sp. 146-12]